MFNLNLPQSSVWWRMGLVLPAALIAWSVDSSNIATPDTVAQTNQLTIGAIAQAETRLDWAAVEQDIIAEHNRVRQNPQSYVPLLQAYLAKMDAKGNIPNGCGPNCTLRTQEGKAAVQEAITFLQNQSALSTVSTSSSVAQASKAHAQDQVGGATGHTGSDGSDPGQRFDRYGVSYRGWGENIDYGSTTAQAVLMSLIIDDGVASRGHRTNIFSPNWTHAGAGCGSHDRYGTVCVIGYIKNGQSSTQGSGGNGSTGNTGSQTSTSPAAANNQLKVIHNGTVDLQSLQIGGVDILGGSLSPGRSRDITLNANQCQADLRLQLGGGYNPLDWPGLTLCGATLTVNDQNGFGLQY